MSKKIEFTPPPAVKNTVGDGLKEGQRLQLMAEFRVKDNGDWCLVAIEGVDMPGYDDETDRTYPASSQFVSNYQSQVNGAS